MHNKEILDLIKFNKESYKLTNNLEFIENNKRLYRELKFNNSFIKNKKIEVKDLSPWIWVNHKFEFVKNMSEEEFDEESQIGFDLNLLHNED